MTHEKILALHIPVFTLPFFAAAKNGIQIFTESGYEGSEYASTIGVN